MCPFNDSHIPDTLLSNDYIIKKNKFGHCISYNDVISLENKVVQQQLQRERDNLILPFNIHPHVFANFCWDNNDRNEDSFWK